MNVLVGAVHLLSPHALLGSVVFFHMVSPHAAADTRIGVWIQCALPGCSDFEVKT